MDLATGKPRLKYLEFVMRLFLYILIVATATSCGSVYHFTATDTTPADESAVYSLPFPEGTSRLLVQGYQSWFSHKGRLGLDFKMKSGSPVTAAREGVVVSVQQDFTAGGVNKKYFRKANAVVIRHSDGTQAMYAHLRYGGAVVKPGDTVQRHQLLAYSGSTGYSAFPHLHFTVWDPRPQQRRQLPTRFYTRKGIRYLRPGRWYRSIP